MKTSPRLKTALLAAASLTVAVAAVTPAGAVAAPPAAIEHVVVAVDNGHEKSAPAITARTAGFAALGAAALAGLARLIGLRRLKAAAAAGAAVATKAAAAGFAITASAAGAVGRAVASPLRAAALLTGLGALALAGVGLYDVEWVGGLAVGALLAAMIAAGAGKFRRAAVKSRASVRR